MANHPHDSKRPESQAVRRALEADDIEALKLALTARQRAFAHEYIVDFNGEKACVRAGYATKWPNRQAYILKQHKGIARYIDYLSQSKEAAITAIDPDYVIAKVTAIISKEDTKDGDRLRGLELLARHLGMFIDRTEITGRDGEAIAVEQRRVEEDAQSVVHLLKSMSDKKEKGLKLVS